MLGLVGSECCLDVHRHRPQNDIVGRNLVLRVPCSQNRRPLLRSTRGSAGDAHRQGFVAFDKAGIHPLGFVDHLNIIEAFQDFLPDDLQLQLGQPDPDATMNAEAEGEVGARSRPVNDEVVRAIDYLFVAVTRTYHITTLSPLLNFLPRNSMSWSAVRRMWASGVCPRTPSGTKLSIKAGFSRSFLY